MHPMNTYMKKINYFINLSFYLYFLVLLGERLGSVIASFVNGVNIFSDAFSIAVYLTVFLSILGWLLYLIFKCRDNTKALFRFDDNIKYRDICIASGILLLSGMVHTEYTTSVVQFISYGILIIGILLKVIENHKSSDSKVSLWLSFIYLVSFSMAIPVMYRSYIEWHTIFHIIESLAFIVLVGIFTMMLIYIFEGTSNLFNPYSIIPVIVLDVPLIALRWNEEINWFVMIFASLSVLVFVIGFTYNQIKQKKH